MRALTHYSHVYESLAPGAPRTAQRDNERLEFLGDAILGFVASDILLHRYPDFSEGKLSERKSHLVSASHLFEIALKLDLGSFLYLGRGEEVTGGRAKKSMLADALEAVIAAIYLDGGIDAARQFVCAHILETESAPLVLPDFKTRLQELARARNLPLPEYRVVTEAGPAHARVFTVKVELGPEYAASGEGPTKKSAAQRAARAVFGKLTEAS